MPVTRKANLTDLENAVTKLVNNEEPAKTPAAAGKPAAGKEKKVSICFQMNETTKDELEQYCIKYDMTLTAAIKKAIREMLDK